MYRLRFTRGKGIRLSVIFTVVVVLSLTFTAALNAIVGYRAQKESLSRNTLELNRITANELSLAVDTIFTSMIQSLKTASAHFSSEGNGGAWADKWLDFMRGNMSFFNSISIVDAKGKITATSPENARLLGTQLSSKAAQQALTERKPLVSEPYVAVTKRLIVLVSYPIYGKDGAYRGFMAGTIYLHENNVLQNILGKQETNGNGSYYFVVDHKGNIIYHPEKARIGESVTENKVVREIMKGREGQMSVINTRGIRMLAGYSIVPSVKWGIVSQTPASNVASSVDEIVTRMMLISAPFIVLIALMVIWVSHRLTNPLHRLAGYASLLNKGETSQMPEPQSRHLVYEANELNRAVIDAFRMMNDRTEALSLEAHTDALTGLRNRRFLDSLLASWDRQRMPYAAILMDLDRFKTVNDTYGHLKGDEVLRFLAARLNEEKRDCDYACRYGGEEFVLLLPYGDKELAYLLAESVRVRLMEEESPIGRPVTLSLGIAAYPQDGASAAEVLHCADEALYRAKESGRNRTVLYEADLYEGKAK